MPDTPAALKTFFSPALVERLASALHSAHPAFARRAFVKDACEGLDALELMDRGRHLARAMAEHLPADYPTALDVILRSLGPEHATDELVGLGMEPFFYLPHVLFVAERGLEHFDESMHAQVELTKRFTAEGSIRPYLVRDPERVLAYLERWTRDPSPHVRRLVSEGTRLRLPWAMRVAWLDAHPERVISLLDALKDDPASLVRRSVANNLNDLGKVHEALLVATCARWLEGANDARRRLVEHALRSAVKRGVPNALALLGYGARPAVSLEDVRLSPKRVAIGADVTLAFALQSTAKTRTPQRILVDVAVHFVKARGTSRKVFKLVRTELAAHERTTFRTRVSLAIHTTRTPRPGAHRVEVLVNGIAFPAGAFDVVPAQRRRAEPSSIEPDRRQKARASSRGERRTPRPRS